MSVVRLVGLVALAIGLIAALGAVTDHVWWRMAAANAVLVPLCLWAVPLRWRELWRPSRRAAAQGVIAAAVLIAAGWLGSQVLFAVRPGAPAEVAAIYGWALLLPTWAAAPLLVAIAAAEEVVWRGAVAFGVAARSGPWWGCAVAAEAACACGSRSSERADSSAGRRRWRWCRRDTR